MTEWTESTKPIRIRNDAKSDPGRSDELVTNRLQHAIDVCHKRGGGTVTITSGEYVAGTIHLRSDVTLHLEAGAHLLPAKDKSEYIDCQTGPDGERPFILADRVRNVSIVGDGTIDGCGTKFMKMDEPIRQHSGESDGHPLVSNASHRARQGEEYLNRSGAVDKWPVAKPPFRPGPMLSFINCENVSVRNVTLQDMPAWTLNFDSCVDVNVHNITIRNHMQIPNCDGISIDSSQNVRISDCMIESCDDAITITSHKDHESNCENVTVTNCSLSSSACAIKLGSETTGNIRYCTFNNCVIHDTNRGLGIQHRDSGSIEHILFSNITVETELLPGPWWGKAEPIYVTSVPRDDETDLGTIRNIRFSNIVADAESGVLVYGHLDANLENIYFDSISLLITGGHHADAVGGNVDLQPTAVMAPIYEEAISGVHCENVTNLELYDVTLEWGKELPNYFAHGVRCLESDKVVIDRFVGRQAHLAETDANESKAAIRLERITGSTVRNSRARRGTQTFLSTADCRDARLFANNDLTDSVTAIKTDSEYRMMGNIHPHNP